MQITIDLPDDLALTESDLRREIAIALFQQNYISLGRASKIARIYIMDFQKLLADRGICVHYDVEDLEQDVQHLRDRGWLRLLSAIPLPFLILPLSIASDC